MLRMKFRAMGCQIEVTTESESDDAHDLLGEVPGWFREWEQILSRFLPDSELTQLNFHPEEPVRVSETFWEVFCAALDMERESSGLVSPAMLNAMVAFGYDRSFEFISSDSQNAWLEPYLPPTLSISDITLDPDLKTIFLPYGLQLDLGGIAKGWAANKAVERLAVSGSALVNAGGDIAIMNTTGAEMYWTVGIVDPHNKMDFLKTLSTGNGGVATSGRDYRHWMQGDLERHHIIDPRTSQPAQSDVLTATVTAPNAMEAEMGAKTALILGSHDGLSWLESRSGFSGFLVLDDGRTVQTSKLKNYL
ncbi:MAG: FAD:protein FMN transferase [Anaerolineaceae bacterium]|nr:FAD:protein FMN transferase [Anaerolineaceae bacterium]